MTSAADKARESDMLISGPMTTEQRTAYAAGYLDGYELHSRGGRECRILDACYCAGYADGKNRRVTDSFTTSAHESVAAHEETREDTK